MGPYILDSTHIISSFEWLPYSRILYRWIWVFDCQGLGHWTGYLLNLSANLDTNLHCILAHTSFFAPFLLDTVQYNMGYWWFVSCPVWPIFPYWVVPYTGWLYPVYRTVSSPMIHVHTVSEEDMRKRKDQRWKAYRSDLITTKHQAANFGGSQQMQETRKQESINILATDMRQWTREDKYDRDKKALAADMWRCWKKERNMMWVSIKSKTQIIKVCGVCLQPNKKTQLFLCFPDHPPNLELGGS